MSCTSAFKPGSNVTKNIDSGALEGVNVALGLSGSGPGDSRTLLDDGNLDQVLSVNDIVRRSLTSGATTGLFYAVMRNVHAGATTELVNVNPYNTQVPIGAFPDPIPRNLEFWIFSAYIDRSAGGGTLSAVLELRYPNENQAWGVDNAGFPVLAPTVDNILAFWDGIATVNQQFAILNGSLQPRAHFNIRVPRDSLLLFRSIASAAATYNLNILCGLFPTALGQDGAV